MGAARVHPIMPTSTHDEVAEQHFVVALKAFITAEMDPALRKVTTEAERGISAQGGVAKPSLQQLRASVSARPLYRNWVSAMPV